MWPAVRKKIKTGNLIWSAIVRSLTFRCHYPISSTLILHSNSRLVIHLFIISMKTHSLLAILLLTTTTYVCAGQVRGQVGCTSSSSTSAATSSSNCLTSVGQASGCSSTEQPNTEGAYSYTMGLAPTESPSATSDTKFTVPCPVTPCNPVGSPMTGSALGAPQPWPVNDRTTTIVSSTATSIRLQTSSSSASAVLLPTTATSISARCMSSHFAGWEWSFCIVSIWISLAF